MDSPWVANHGVWMDEQGVPVHTTDGVTLPEKLTAKAPENRPSQKETSIPSINFQVRAVSFRG